MTPRKLFCFGYGFSARVFAQRRRAEGWNISASLRDPSKAQTLMDDGVTPVSLPVPSLDAVIEHGTHLLISAAPGAAGDPLLAAHRDEIAVLHERFSWIGYLSTTAVYGDHGGGQVTERTPVSPGSARGKLRAQAERDWLSLAQAGLPVHVFRLAGIYGPGRGPLEKVRSGQAKRIIKQGQVFGRIHVEDIARVLEASIVRPNPGAIYNVTDECTCPPQEVIAHAAELLRLPIPPEVPFEQADMSPMARSFYAENKRVSNERMKRELGVNLAYPTYREGLRALMEAEKLGGGLC